MHAVRGLFTITVLAVCARGAAAQGVSQGAAVSSLDTLPERVVMRFFDAWRRHDLDATFANYDSVYTFENFITGSHQRRRDDSLRRTKADTAVMRIINGMTTTLVRSDVYGAFVNQEWTERFADGREFKHFELLEVRGGKIVRQIEGNRLLNPHP